MKLDKIKKLSKNKLENLTEKSEFQHQVECVNWCKKKNILCFSVPNEATRNNSSYTRSGVLPGVSDLIVVIPNKVLFIEMKDYKGSQSDYQEKFQLRIESLGYEYHICRNLEQFKKIIE